HLGATQPGRRLRMARGRDPGSAAHAHVLRTPDSNLTCVAMRRVLPFRSVWCGRYHALVGSFGVFRQAWVAEGFPDALGSWGADALADRKCLLQIRGGLAGVAFVEVAVADSFQGPCFLGSGADVAGDGQRLGVLVAGLAGGRDAVRELAEAVQRFGLAEPVAEVTEQCQGLLVAGGGGRVVPRLLLYPPQVVERA